MSAPTWSEVDSDTASLLDLLSDDGSFQSDWQWSLFRTALLVATDPDCLIDPNRLRDLIGGRIKPQRVGAFTHRALRAGLVEHTGRWITSTDTKGRNSGKPCREMRWIGGDH